MDWIIGLIIGISIVMLAGYIFLLTFNHNHGVVNEIKGMPPKEDIKK